MGVEAEHIMVGGPSGGGKSTFLREQHARYDGLSVFLTTKPNERKAATNPPKRVRKSSCTYPQDIEQTREWALSRSETVQIIVDEAQNAPSFIDGDGPVRDGLHEDRSRGVTWCVATQDPSDLRTNKTNYGPIQQCKYWVWVGPVKTWHTGFFKANGMNDLIPHLPAKNYEYVVLDPAAALEPEDRIIYRGQTKRQYG